MYLLFLSYSLCTPKFIIIIISFFLATVFNGKIRKRRSERESLGGFRASLFFSTHCTKKINYTVYYFRELERMGYIREKRNTNFGSGESSILYC